MGLTLQITSSMKIQCAEDCWIQVVDPLSLGSFLQRSDLQRNFEDFLRIFFILEGNSEDFLEFSKIFEDFRDLGRS